MPMNAVMRPLLTPVGSAITSYR